MGLKTRIRQLETAKKETHPRALFDLLPEELQAITTPEDLDHWKGAAPVKLLKDAPALALWCALCGEA